MTGSSAGLAAIFNPSGIAVVGASPRETNLGVRFVRGLTRHGYGGTLRVVNRSGSPVDEVAASRSISELPKETELAILALRADLVEDAVRELGENGISAAIVFSSGFAEVGGEGVAAQERLLEVARTSGVRLLGPNCVGFANPLDGVCPMASGFAFRERIFGGTLGIIAQSGGVAGLIGERAQDHGIGISLSIATGNEADIGAAEVLDYMVEDGRTKAVAMYLEAVRRPEALIAALGRARKAGIGVAIFKAGTGERTAAAAAAHTGSVVGNDGGFDAMCRQTGACRVDSLDDIFLVPPIMAALDTSGSRVAILSTSGGAGVAVADACERAGLELPEVSAGTARKVADVTPGFSSQNNPIDITGTFVVEMEQFRSSLEIIGDAEEFDVSVLVMTVHPPRLADEIAEAIVNGADPSRVCVVWAAGSQSQNARARLREAGFAVSESPSACAAALGALGGRTGAGSSPELIWPPAQGELPGPEPSTVLTHIAGHGVPVAPMVHVTERGQVTEVCASLGFPLVMKADGAEHTHKTELGGVAVGISTLEDALGTWDRFEASGLTSSPVLAQSQVRASRELLMTVAADGALGLSLVIGFGGTLTEAIARAAVILPPVDEAGMRRVLAEAGLGRLAGEFRGEPAIDIAALTAAARSLLRAASSIPGLLHLELNPVLIAPDGRPVAVDALLELESSNEEVPDVNQV